MKSMDLWGCLISVQYLDITIPSGLALMHYPFSQNLSDLAINCLVKLQMQSTSHKCDIALLRKDHIYMNGSQLFPSPLTILFKILTKFWLQDRKNSFKIHPKGQSRVCGIEKSRENPGFPVPGKPGEKP